MANINTEYEHLVAQMYQGMLAYNGFENLRVDHDVKIVGKSGATHQIDVFWELKAAGIIYRTCVECKNYSSAIKKTHVAAFSGVLKDIGNANGVIATTSSFQKGAKQLAAQNNIRLVRVDHLIRSIHLKMQPTPTRFDNVSIKFNVASAKEALIRNRLKSYDTDCHLMGDHFLLDCHGKNKETFSTFVKKHVTQEGEHIIDASSHFLYLENLGLVELESVTVDMSFYQAPAVESIIELSGSKSAVIEDIVNNNVHYLHDDGTVTAYTNKV